MWMLSFVDALDRIQALNAPLESNTDILVGHYSDCEGVEEKWEQ